MAVPAQIRKQSEEIQKLYQQMAGDTPPEGAAPPADQEDVATPEAPPADAPTGANEPATPIGASEHGATGGQNWEQKYKSLQGMFNAEVARSQSSKREQEARISQLEQLLATLSSQTAAPKSTPASAPSVLITDKDREEYGDSIDVMRKAAREEVGSIAGKLAELEATIAQLSSNIVPQVQNVARRQAQSAEENFWNGLAAAVPDWQQTNNRPDFQAWLLEVDPLTGGTRQSFLERAQEKLDVGRVVAFFRAFEQQSVPPVNTNAQPTRQASELEKQIAPGRARGSSTPANQQPQTYTGNDIKKFFEDVRKGVYKGRESERDRIERDIFAAQREGRITAT